jgi:hypothetical protein
MYKASPKKDIKSTQMNIGIILAPCISRSIDITYITVSAVRSLDEIVMEEGCLKCFNYLSSKDRRITSLLREV